MNIRQLILHAIRAALTACLVASVTVHAQTVGASFAGSYSATDLGTPADLPPLFGSDQSSVVWQTIQLPGGSHLVESGCDTITFEAGCDECQPAP